METTWEVWLMVVISVTIFGLIAQRKHTSWAPVEKSARTSVDPQVQSRVDIYGIRAPEKTRVTEDRLETGL